MGANGSFARGDANTEEGRKYKNVFSINENIKVLEPKNPKQGTKLPEESHTPNRIYTAFKKDGSDVKLIAKYGDDGKKLWEIHTDEHDGIKPHFHYWKNGGQDKAALHLTKEMKNLLDLVRNFKND